MSNSMFHWVTEYFRVCSFKLPLSCKHQGDVLTPMQTNKTESYLKDTYGLNMQINRDTITAMTTQEDAACAGGWETVVW